MKKRHTQYPTLAAYDGTAARRRDDGAAATTPAVSVVTVTMNAVRHFDRMVDSLHGQSFRDFEHVVVDGGSTDGTVGRAQARIRADRDVCISEPDRGISDAFNKGVALSRGAYVQFLNADDWMSSDQLEQAVAALERSGADFVFGDLIFYVDGRPAYRYRGDADYVRLLHKRMPSINHPTVLARRSAFERIGLFDPNLRCAMEYDWFLRLHTVGGWGVYEPRIVGHMTHEGVSNLQFRRTIDEVRRIAVHHGRNPLLATVEAGSRLAKTSFGNWVRSHAEPLYSATRKAINPSFHPF